VSFKIIMTTSVTRSCFTKLHQTCKTKTTTETDFFWTQTGLVLRPTVSDHITGENITTAVNLDGDRQRLLIFSALISQLGLPFQSVSIEACNEEYRVQSCRKFTFNKVIFCVTRVITSIKKVFFHPCLCLSVC